MPECPNCANLTREIDALNAEASALPEIGSTPQTDLENAAELLASDDPELKAGHAVLRTRIAIGTRVTYLAEERLACEARNHLDPIDWTDCEPDEPAEPVDCDEVTDERECDEGIGVIPGGSRRSPAGKIAAAAAAVGVVVVGALMLGGGGGGGGGGKDTESAAKSSTTQDVSTTSPPTTSVATVPPRSAFLVTPNDTETGFAFSAGECSPESYTQTFRFTSTMLDDGTVQLSLTQVETNQVTTGAFAADGTSVETTGSGDGYTERYALRRVDDRTIEGTYTYASDSRGDCAWEIDATLPSDATWSLPNA